MTKKPALLIAWAPTASDLTNPCHVKWTASVGKKQHRTFMTVDITTAHSYGFHLC